MPKYVFLGGDEEERFPRMTVESMLAREIIKRDKIKAKQEKKKEEEKKNKSKPSTLTFREAFFWIFALSVPIGSLELLLLHQFQQYLNNLVYVPH